MYRAIRLVDRVTDSILLLFFLLLFLIGGYTMYDTLLIYDAASGEDLRSFRPVAAVDGEEGFVWDMNALSEDVVAWLTVDDTNIDYPVMQGIDNSEYLNKDPFGEFSLSGSIFLDARNTPDFTDPYSLIYGHHMEYGQMFGALDEFLDQEYFDAHRVATLTVDDTAYRIEFFACIEADATVPEIFAPTEAEGTLEYVRENASIWYDPMGEDEIEAEAKIGATPRVTPAPTPGAIAGMGDETEIEPERLIALSTCKFPQTTARIIVFGVLKDEE